MKKIYTVFFIIFIVSSANCYAQFSRYIIKFKNKEGNVFSISNPSQFLTQRSIDRRNRYNIKFDETDLPVTSAYVDSIRLSGNITILNSSKWLNQVCIQTTDAAALSKINSFSFVLATSPIAARFAQQIQTVDKLLDTPNLIAPVTTTNKPFSPADYYNYGQSYAQIHLNNTEFLHNHGFKGEGMQLSVMDGGFYHYQSLPTFDSVRSNNQILGTYDFVNNKVNVNEGNAHGMDCLSTIAANMPGTFVGTAPKTSFYLFVTEDVNSEYPIEEQNWAAAAERADSLGVDVFSVSLGYNTFDNNSLNHSYTDMNGKTTIIARAAAYAAKKGIIVTVSAGNDGNGSWHYIATPADADSILTVGAVSTSRQVASFSSYGPTSDGRIKPDVAAVGANAVIANPNTGNPAYGNGTSFACPIMAGVTTCLWQAFPEINNIGIIDALHRSADKFATPDNRTGYGIPDTKKAFVFLIKKLYKQQITLNSNCKTSINFSIKAASDMNVFVERKLPSEADYKVISSQHAKADFVLSNFNFDDDLNAFKNNMAIQYRIKMAIGNDTTFYMDSAIVNYVSSCNAASKEIITISPNPVTDKLSVTITKNNTSTAAIEVYGLNGQKVYSLNNQIVTGTQVFTIPMKNLNAGIYLISVFINDKKEYTKKLLLK